jgi:hypothetical protein
VNISVADRAVLAALSDYLGALGQKADAETQRRLGGQHNADEVTIAFMQSDDERFASEIDSAVEYFVAHGDWPAMEHWRALLLLEHRIFRARAMICAILVPPGEAPLFKSVREPMMQAFLFAEHTTGIAARRVEQSTREQQDLLAIVDSGDADFDDLAIRYLLIPYWRAVREMYWHLLDTFWRAKPQIDAAAAAVKR